MSVNPERDKGRIYFSKIENFSWFGDKAYVEVKPPRIKPKRWWSRKDRKCAKIAESVLKYELRRK